MRHTKKLIVSILMFAMIFASVPMGLSSETVDVFAASKGATSQDPITLKSGKAVSGSLSSKKMLTYYSLKTNGLGKIKVVLDAPKLESGVALEIRQQGGEWSQKKIFDYTAKTKGKKKALSSTVYLPEGNYLIVVTGVGTPAKAVKYNLTATAVAQKTHDSEPNNNSYETAQKLDVKNGTQYTMFLSTNSEQIQNMSTDVIDWFRFTMTEENDVRLYIKCAPRSSYVKVEIFTSLSDLNNPRFGPMETASGVLDKTLDLDQGVYYVKVTHVGPATQILYTISAQSIKRPKKVTISDDTLTLWSKKTEGRNTYRLSATVTPDYAFNKKVTWTSSNPKVAKVNQSGDVTGVGAGTAVIKATSKANKRLYATCKVTVKKKTLVKKIALDQTVVTLWNNIAGGATTAKLKATINPSNANNKKVTWKSSNTAVATVNAKGEITAVAPGTATITVTAKDKSKKSASCTVTVKKYEAPKPKPTPKPTPTPEKQEKLVIQKVGSNTLYVGATVTYQANISGGTWSCKGDLENLGSGKFRLKAAKGGTVSYTVNGQTAAVSVSAQVGH